MPVILFDIIKLIRYFTTMNTQQMTSEEIAQAYNNLPKQERTLPARETHDIAERVTSVPEEDISREVRNTLNAMLEVLATHV